MSPSARRVSRSKPKQPQAASAARRMNAPVILATTDFSQESMRALDYAAHLRKFFGGSLHLVHVHDAVDTNYAISVGIAMSPIVSPEEIDRYYQQKMRKLAAKYSVEKRGGVHAKTGRAFDQICRLAEEIGAQLIVISTHGRTGLKRVFLGSTTERVVQHAPCPVLVVREHERDFAELAPSRAKKGGAPGMKILVPMDYSDCAREGLAFAIAFARPWKAELILLHTVQVQPVIALERFAAYEQTRSLGAIERAARKGMSRLTRGIDFGDVPHKTVIQTGPPAQEICRYAEHLGMDLIITSTHGETGFAHVLIGSVAEHIVRFAPCPVLVVPAREKRRAA